MATLKLILLLSIEIYPFSFVRKQLTFFESATKRNEKKNCFRILALGTVTPRQRRRYAKF